MTTNNSENFVNAKSPPMRVLYKDNEYMILAERSGVTYTLMATVYREVDDVPDCHVVVQAQTPKGALVGRGDCMYAEEFELIGRLCDTILVQLTSSIIKPG